MLFNWIFINFSIVPITNLSGWKDEATAWSYDWSQAAEALATRPEKGATFSGAHGLSCLRWHNWPDRAGRRID